jgi:hypothetical protein
MCQDFSCLVARSAKVFWKLGVSSHDNLIHIFQRSRELHDSSEFSPAFSRIEYKPDKGYMHPNASWSLNIDEDTTPVWWGETHAEHVRLAWREWKKQMYAHINMVAAHHPVNPLKITPPEITPDILALVARWVNGPSDQDCSVYQRRMKDNRLTSLVTEYIDTSLIGPNISDSLFSEVYYSVCDGRGKVGRIIHANVGAYVGSLIDTWGEPYPWALGTQLWGTGLLPYYNDWAKEWELYGGPECDVLWHGVL